MMPSSATPRHSGGRFCASAGGREARARSLTAKASRALGRMSGSATAAADGMRRQRKAACIHLTELASLLGLSFAVPRNRDFADTELNHSEDLRVVPLYRARAAHDYFKPPNVETATLPTHPGGARSSLTPAVRTTPASRSRARCPSRGRSASPAAAQVSPPTHN